MRRSLEIGGGNHPAFGPPGWEQFDARPLPHVQHVGDARALPFPDDTFQEVYSSNTLEHFGWQETDAVLAEWVRVLVPGGVLTVITPDLLGIIADYLVGNEEFAMLVKRLYGGQEYPENAHYAGFTWKSFGAYLTRAGLVEVAITRSHQGGGIHGVGRKP